MCISNNSIKFCTCVEGNIDEIKNIYIWTLSRCIGPNESLRRGKIMIPVKDFENGISVDSIISKLNTENIFDFEYNAQERDSLHISFNAKNREEYQYFSLIFWDGRWQEGRNSVFTSIIKKIAGGEVKIINKDENREE